MTQDDIIRMARKAGMVVIDDEYTLVPFLEEFAALVVAAEREACAKVCEKYVLACNFWHPNAHPGRWFADAIRARGADD